MVITGVVMTFSTGVSAGTRKATRWARSRSVMMPSGRPSGSVTVALEAIRSAIPAITSAHEVPAVTARGTRRMKSFTSLLKMAVWDRTATSLARPVVFTCA